MSMLASGLRGVVSATRRLSGVGSVAMKPSCASAISHAAARPVALAGACRHISGGRAGAASDPPFASLSQTIQAEEARFQAAGPNFNIRVFHFEEALEGLNSNQPLDYVDEVDDVTPLIDLIGPKDEMHMIKRTYQPSVLKKKRTHGFLARLADRNGRKILARRRRKNRARLAV